MALVYNTEKDGIGKVVQGATPLTVIRSILLTTPDFEFSSFANFATQAQYLSAIAAGTMYPIQGILEDEVQNFEDKVMETSTGRKVFQFEGIRGRRLKVILSLEQHKILRTYSFTNWRVFLVDNNGNIIGTTPDGTKVKGFSLSYFRVPPMATPSANDAPFSLIDLQFASISEFDSKGVMVNPTWLAADIQGVLSVTLTASAVSGNSTTITVAYVDDSQLTPAGASESVAVSGLSASSIKILNGTSEVTTGKTLTETAVAGTYTLAATTLIAGYTVQVIATATDLYKSAAVTLAS